MEENEKNNLKEEANFKKEESQKDIYKIAIKEKETEIILKKEQKSMLKKRERETVLNLMKKIFKINFLN